mgnify:FL=1
MDPITIGIICWISSAVAISIGSSQDTNDKNQKAPPKIVKPPTKTFLFVGNTGSGISCTINALVGSPACKVGATHQTTTQISETIFLSGYKLRDTPGLMDSTNFSSHVWNNLMDVELVVYTVSGQLYRPELLLIEKIFNAQKRWNLLTPSYRGRKLVLYVNKQDIKQVSMTGTAKKKEALAIQPQVSPWIDSSKIVFGSSSPNLHGHKGVPQVEELNNLILEHIKGE